jgi:hypothetical protein
VLAALVRLLSLVDAEAKEDLLPYVTRSLRNFVRPAEEDDEKRDRERERENRRRSITRLATDAFGATLDLLEHCLNMDPEVSRF